MPTDTAGTLIQQALKEQQEMKNGTQPPNPKQKDVFEELDDFKIDRCSTSPAGPVVSNADGGRR